MTKLKGSDFESWQYLEESFSIIKSKIPFVGIGIDNALEQENKVMQVAGGAIGLTQNQAALNQFCLSAPILSLFTQQFLEKNNVDVYNRKHLYELQKTSSQRIYKIVDKLVECMEMLEINFSPSGDVFNVFTEAILANNLYSDLLKHDQIGNEL